MINLTEKLTPLKQTSLYIHIPYCKKKCSYCDFYSTKLSSNTEIEAVLSRILDDTETILHKLERPEIKTLFIGGGTPSSIPLDLLENFLKKINLLIKSSPIESTIELNPETVNKDLLGIISANGIQRVSVGVQSLDERVLRTLGRNTDALTTLEGLEIIRKHWKGSLSIDLINAVPGQTITSSLSDIERIDKFNPDHISLYSLTFEPATELYSKLKAGKISTLSEITDLKMQIESLELLESLGYKRYEISNFAKEGKSSLHNLNYWNMGSYLGVGPSAASTLLTGSGPVRLIYNRSISNFIGSSSLEDRFNIEYLEPDSFLLEHLMMGFRLINGVKPDHINNVFDIDLINYLEPIFIKWNEMLIIETGSIRLTNNGLSLLNPFLIDIAALIADNHLQISGKEINWPILTAQF
ncbi:MAG: radical SAM family heme chaperone HemW [Spirochaetota bacterium]|nr:radical SAM family heme chaperone HemW [Spirochaetota bacterium]